MQWPPGRQVPWTWEEGELALVRSPGPPPMVVSTCVELRRLFGAGSMAMADRGSHGSSIAAGRTAGAQLLRTREIGGLSGGPKVVRWRRSQDPGGGPPHREASWPWRPCAVQHKARELSCRPQQMSPWRLSWWDNPLMRLTSPHLHTGHGTWVLQVWMVRTQRHQMDRQPPTPVLSLARLTCSSLKQPCRAPGAAVPPQP